MHAGALERNRKISVRKYSFFLKSRDSESGIRIEDEDREKLCLRKYI